MEPIELKITRIGNSRGVRLPAATIERYHLGERVIMEERSDGILLRPLGPAQPKLSWDDTASEMHAAQENWSGWESAAVDGLRNIVWESPAPRRAAEPTASYSTPTKSSSKTSRKR